MFRTLPQRIHFEKYFGEGEGWLIRGGFFQAEFLGTILGCAVQRLEPLVCRTVFGSHGIQLRGSTMQRLPVTV